MLSPALPKRATALLLKGLESGTPAQAASNNAYPIFLTKIFVKGVLCAAVHDKVHR